MLTREKARQLRALIEQAVKSLNDADALDGVELFPQWITEHAYNVNDRIKFENVLYKCVQAHTSQESWKPNLTPALWTRVTVEEWPEWVQPLGTQDAYNEGDKVSHNGKHWVSMVNNNVWEPSVYGWEEVS